jgi:hypothetical protein
MELSHVKRGETALNVGHADFVQQQAVKDLDGYGFGGGDFDWSEPAEAIGF